MENSTSKQLFLYKYIVCIIVIFSLTAGFSYYNQALFPQTNKEADSPFYFSQHGYLSEAGGVLRYAIPIGALAYALAMKDTPGMVQLVSSYSVTFTIAYTIKKFIHEERPLHQGNNSFPSGHSANAFSGAWFLLRRYGINITFILAAVLASVTAFSRVATGWHHIQDVLTSLVVAAIIAYFWVTPYVKKKP